MANLSTNPTSKTITIDKVANVISEIISVEFDKYNQIHKNATKAI